MDEEAVEHDPDGEFAAETAGPTAGQRLREEREAQGIDMAQLVAETRIPQRHLVAIETGNYSALPSRTYAIGFTRTYARHLGLDENDLLAQTRRELAEDQNSRSAPARYEPGDPARVPSSRLAWFGALAAILFLVGGFVFYRTYFAPGLGPAPLTADEPAGDTPIAAASNAPTRPTPAPTGPVVFTSEMDGTWVKFYDADGERLYEAQMNEGDKFTIPADAEGPQVWTGRPYALAITVGGQSVPKLSEEDEVVRDVPVTAEALLARPASATSPADSAAAPASDG